MTTQPEALRLADALAVYLPKPHDMIDAAAELRRLSRVEQQRDELLEAMRRIAMASEATVCNQDWVAKTARAAIAKTEATVCNQYWVTKTARAVEAAHGIKEGT